MRQASGRRAVRPVPRLVPRERSAQVGPAVRPGDGVHGVTDVLLDCRLVDRVVDGGNRHADHLLGAETSTLSVMRVPWAEQMCGLPGIRCRFRRPRDVLTAWHLPGCDARV